MSIILCLGTFLAVLLFILMIVIVWLVAKPDEGSLTSKEALNEIKNSSHLTDKIFTFLVYLTRFTWRGLLGLISTMGLAAFSCLGSICAADVIEVLKVIRLILQEFYSFLEKVTGP